MYHLKDFGSFHIGGKTVEIQGQPLKQVVRNKDFIIEINPNGHYAIDAIYVQYFLPANHKHNVVLIHGGGHTGAVWETTPDGRKGWLHLLLEQNVGVYVVDTVERGRAGWCALPGIWPGGPEECSNEQAWSAFRLGPDENFTQKIPYLNQKFPVDNFDAFVKHNVPRWNCNAENSAKALSMLIHKIGKCSLIAHSQGVDIAVQCFNLVSKYIKNVVLIEPAAFPILNANTTYNNTKIISLFGDYIQLSPLWAPLKKKSIEYTNYLNNLGITAKFVDLPEMGVMGNCHMMMMDRNNHEILQMILEFMGII